MGLIDDRFEQNLMVTSLDFVFNWARRSSLWWLQFGLACCGIEMISAQMSRWDMSERFGNLQRLTPAGRFHDRGRDRDQDDGPPRPDALRPDARAEMGAFDGIVRERGWSL